MDTVKDSTMELKAFNFTKYLSDEGRILFEVVNLASLCCVIASLGIAANIINIIIFYKQGFKNTVNIGFFGLAISDTSCLIPLVWGSICMNPLFVASGIKWFPMEVMYLTTSWPHVCFSRITSWITVYITTERYLSIALPLKVKSIITPKTATCVLCLIFLVNLSTFVPEYTTSYIGWKYFASKNETLIGILFTDSRKSVDGVIYFFNFFLGVTSFSGVIILTALLVVKLRESANWRKGMILDSVKHEAISVREKKTVKMVVLIACVLIACYSPAALISLATFILGHDFTITGRYVNTGEAMWTSIFVAQSVNSSVNIFIYYSMSSKYRQTFEQVLPVCKSSHQKSSILASEVEDGLHHTKKEKTHWQNNITLKEIETL